MAQTHAADERRRLLMPEAVRLREAGLTTKEIGARLGVSQSAVSIWLPFHLRILDPHRLRDRREALELGVDHRVLTEARSYQTRRALDLARRERMQAERRAVRERQHAALLAQRELARAARRAERERTRDERRIARAIASARRITTRPQVLSLDRATFGGYGPSLSEFIADPNAADPAATAAFNELERTVLALVGTTDLDEIASLGVSDREQLQRRLIDLGLTADHRSELSPPEVDTRDVWTRPERSGVRVYGHAPWARGAPCDDGGEPFDPDNHWRSLAGTGRGRCICGELSPVLPTRRQRLEWLDAHAARYAPPRASTA